LLIFSILPTFHIPLTPEGVRGGHAGRDTIGRSADRPTPIKVKHDSEAIPLILAGKTVELPSVRKVNTLLSRLAKMAKEAKARGEDAPTYDLCLAVDQPCQPLGFPAALGMCDIGRQFVIPAA
jgi:hypothetical protein